MNVLFFSLDDFDSIENYRSINTDLLREFKRNGHNVFVVSPSERKMGLPTRMIQTDNVTILKPKIGNIQKTNPIEKGISTISIGRILVSAMKKYFSEIMFDLILYCTPPITFLKPIEYIKKRDNARTYLLLKDIFPQNAVDIGMLGETGIKGILYRYFRKQEKRLYAVSDRIGCMSQANVDYVVKHNPEIDAGKVEVCPNSIEVVDKSADGQTRVAVRKQYGIPLDKTVFVYGGNLGKPQGIPFIIECLKVCRDLDCFFLIIGDGTEYHVLEDYAKTSEQVNFKLMKRLPKEDYDNMVGACDVGLIFLDHRFTIPNFPSRLLSYMQAKLPVLACTDPNTDMGKVITEGGFGWWCESDDATALAKLIKKILKSNNNFGFNGYDYLRRNYGVEKSYQIIQHSINKG